jgi:ribose transport system permease protein
VKFLIRLKTVAQRPVWVRNRPVLLAYALVVVLGAFGEAAASGFLTVSHIDQLVIEASFTALVAVGQLFVIISGGIDLSIPWVLNGSAVLLTLFANGSDTRVTWLFPLLLLAGAAIGLINGVGVAFLRVPPIIMTLGMSSMVEGGLLLYTNGGSGGFAPAGIVYLATHRWGPLPVVALVWLAVLVVATVVLSATPFGRRLYATGLSRKVAEFSGVSVRSVTISVYVISGVSAALAGLVLSGYVGESYLGMGDPYLFSSVAAVAIGGASILGGTGNYIGTTAGALVLAVLAAILPILGFTQATLEIVYGCVILIAVSLSSLRLAAGRNLE